MKLRPDRRLKRIEKATERHIARRDDWLAIGRERANNGHAEAAEDAFNRAERIDACVAGGLRHLGFPSVSAT